MSDFDQSVLAYYQEQGGATAWICSGALNSTREDVSKALQRLKRKGVMKNKGPFWEWKAPSRQEVGYD